MSGTCVSKLLLTAGGKGADKLLSVTPLLDPSDPNNDSNPAMQLYKTTVKKYSDADVEPTASSRTAGRRPRRSPRSCAARPRSPVRR